MFSLDCLEEGHGGEPGEGVPGGVGQALEYYLVDLAVIYRPALRLRELEPSPTGVHLGDYPTQYGPLLAVVMGLFVLLPGASPAYALHPY